jgi:hypothetical protein
MRAAVVHQPGTTPPLSSSPIGRPMRGWLRAARAGCRAGQAQSITHGHAGHPQTGIPPADAEVPGPPVAMKPSAAPALLPSGIMTQDHR